MTISRPFGKDVIDFFTAATREILEHPERTVFETRLEDFKAEKEPEVIVSGTHKFSIIVSSGSWKKP
jgi:hypothetical protein